MSEDLIRRSDAIKALNREKSDWNCDYNVPIDNCIKRLNKVKSIDRPQGEWVDDGLDAIGVMGVEYRWHKCSQCGFRISKSPSVYYPNFCEACGARMKGADDEASD